MQAQTTSTAPDRSRLQSLAPIAVFDVLGPLVVYYALRSAGASTVASLVLSGAPPALGITLTVVRRRRLDANRGTGTGTDRDHRKLGPRAGERRRPPRTDRRHRADSGLRACLPRLTLVKPTDDLPLCPAGHGSRHRQRTRLRRPMALCRLPARLSSNHGPRSSGARPSSPRPPRRSVIIQTSSAGTAKATSNFMPLVVATVVIAWNVCYAKRGRRRGRLADKALQADRETPPGTPSSASST